MQNNFYIFILLALILVFCLWAVEKPTTVTEACVTTECHNLRVQNKHVHRPVALGSANTVINRLIGQNTRSSYPGRERNSVQIAILSK